MLKWKALRVLLYNALFTFLVIQIMLAYDDSANQSPQYIYPVHMVSKRYPNESVRNLHMWNTRLNNEWILNKNILQYSSYIIFKENNRTTIEALIMPVNALMSNSNWKCILKSADGLLTLYGVTTSFKIERVINDKKKRDRYTTRIYRVKCEFISNTEIDSQSLVAIIDATQFGQKRVASDLGEGTLSFEYLKYQLPGFINATMPKKKSIGHCIHMIYDLEFEDRKNSLAQFFDIITDLHIDKVRMYIYRHHSLVDLNLLKKYKFLTVVHHDAVHHRVCQLDIYNLNFNPNSTVLKQLYDECLAAYLKLFPIIELERVKGIHDELNTNDCYLNFRYLYEIVNNYDFDEFIWPHKSKMGQLQTFYDDMNGDLRSVCNHGSMEINAYEHQSMLLGNIRNKGVLSLHHIVMLGFTQNLDLFFKNLNDALSKEINDFSVVDFQEMGKVFKFKINKNQVPYAKQLVQYYNVARQMYYYLNKTEVRWNLNRAVALHANFRLGKSIYNTNTAEMLNVHNAYIPKPTAVQHTVAYVSHFREFYVSFFPTKNGTLSIEELYIDMEYYHFLFRKYVICNDH
jgi:hypothetical protein